MNISDIFVETDAGRRSSKRPKQVNDCTVRAIAVALNIDYDAAYDLMKAAGRPCSKGFDFRGRGIPFLKGRGVRLTWKAFPAEAGQKRMKPETFCAAHPSGTYVLKLAKHVVTVRDGKVHDLSPSDVAGRCVYGAWKVN
jgi:hypothetical protein